MNPLLLGLAIFAATAISACAGGDRAISTALGRQVKANPPGPIDLSTLGPPTWTRVCVFGPYTTRELAETQLGFKWDIDRHSGIGGDDSITLLVFIRESEVVAYTEHPRSEGDFLKLSPRCLSRPNAKLIRNTKEEEPNQLVAGIKLE